ncbi:MAG TPA: DHA2 family efflux MFS transporter permease subunit [Solirubrobacteraceae bacterium]|jgi:EmrB/QacA subfamily drug resistance transporter|nr:DHA2 family efflux MFS transporter permease subunit [Solirubrobacteraceae bacterium]
MTNKQKWVLVLTAIASLMVALDVTVVSTALSTMRLHLHASIDELEWTVNAYGLSFAVLLMTGAVLGDRLGRRRLFVGGLVLFSAASVACALSADVGWLIAARAVQGAGAALIAPVSLALLSAAFPPERRGSALGIYGAITGLAVVAGPVVGGAVTQGLAWQWIFWLNVPIGLAAIPFVLARIDEGYGPRAGLDVPGLALVTGAALGIVWGLVRGNTVGWGSPEVVGTLAGGVLFSVLFVLWELRASEPMLPMGLFRSRGFAAGNMVGLLMFAALFSAVFFMAQYQQTVLGQSPLDTGLRLIPWTGTVFLVSPLAGALVDRVGERPLIVSGLLMQAAGFAWIALTARTGLPYSHMIAPLILAGVGVSTALPAAQNAALGGVPPREIGKAAGTFSTMRQLGGSLGLAVAVAVFTGAGSYTSPEAFSNGFGPAIGVSAALSLCGALTGLALRARTRGSASAVPSLQATGGS